MSGVINVVPVGTRSPAGIDAAKGVMALEFLAFLVLCFERCSLTKCYCSLKV